MRIDFSEATPSKCAGVLHFNGNSYPCLGKFGFPYPADITIGVKDKGTGPNGSVFSTEFQCHLPWAVLLIGQRGVYLHEDVSGGDLSRSGTAGCINLLRADAIAVYAGITTKVRVLIKTPW
jgi:lipoprotein-anchoring transpeptidase ErfK/SrfK